MEWLQELLDSQSVSKMEWKQKPHTNKQQNIHIHTPLRSAEMVIVQYYNYQIENKPSHLDCRWARSRCVQKP